MPFLLKIKNHFSKKILCLFFAEFFFFIFYAVMCEYRGSCETNVNNQLSFSSFFFGEKLNDILLMLEIEHCKLFSIFKNCSVVKKILAFVYAHILIFFLLPAISPSSLLFSFSGQT